jgi:hypothetical protein
MRAPWKRQKPSPIEELLRENRPEPRAEFTTRLLERLASGRRAGLRRPSLAPGRAFAAIALTALALVGATVAAGGPINASSGLVGFVDVGHHGNGGEPGKPPWGDPGKPGNWQYTVPICHKKGHDDWELRHLSPIQAIFDLIHNPYDFIVFPWLHCPPYGGKW